MDFSKTKVYQRTRSCYEKLYLEFNVKKNKGRHSNDGLISESDGDRVKTRADGVVSSGESFGKSSEGIKGGDGRIDEINVQSRKLRKRHKGREELRRVSKRGKNARGVGLDDEPSGSVNLHGGIIDESEDDEGVTYLGDDVTCLDDYDPSHSSRVGSNEVKVTPVELDSIQVDDDDPVELDSIQADDDDPVELDSQALKLSEDDDDPQKLVSSEENNSRCRALEQSENAAAAGGSEKDLVVITSSSSDCEDDKDGNVSVDGDGVDSIVLEVKHTGDTLDTFWTEEVKKRPADEGHGEENGCCVGEYHLKGKRVDKSGKDTDKADVMEPGARKRGCNSVDERTKMIESGLKKRRMDANTLLGHDRNANERWHNPAKCLPSDFCSLHKSDKNQLVRGINQQPVLNEDDKNADLSFEDNNDEGGEGTSMQIVGEKGTQRTWNSTGRNHTKLGKEIDVIRILTDTIRVEGDGDKLLREYVTSVEDTPPDETPVGQVLSYKFKFEDEDMKVDKLESELEIDVFFDEMNMCLQLSEIGTSGPPVVDCGDADFLVEGTDQATRCRQGKHQLALNDQFGIICRCCPYVEMEIRDILPPLSKNGRGGHDRHEIDKADNLKASNLQWAGCNREHVHDSKGSDYEKGTVWDLVPGVKETMYPHQRDGFEFIWKKIAGGTYIEKLEKRLPNGGSGCIISHAPGTGKSRLTIVFLQAFMRMYQNARPLIIAPRSMLLTWEEEFKKWDVDVPFYILNNNECSGQEDAVAATLLKQAGNGKSVRCLRLLKLYSWKKKPSVLGITYRLFESLAGEEGKRKRALNNPEDEETKRILLQVPTLLVLDEGHTPRNDQSLVWKALLNVKTKRSIILSGTPFQNNFDELYNTLCLVNPLLSFGISSISGNVLSGKRRGWKNNTARGQWDSITSSIKKSQQKIDELRALIDPFVHVHKGTILQERLPGLRDALVVLKPTRTQKTLLGKMKGTKSSLENDYLMSLVSVHPSLLPKSYSNNEGFHKVLKIFERDPRAGVKTNFLIELIKLSGALNEKVLVFSQYIKPLEFIMELLKSNFKWIEGRECLYMDGQQEEKQRQSSINTLNDPKSEVKVLLASLRACSEGINLVGASRVVLLDVHWNPSVERQAISRAYRLGQKKLVHVYHLVTGTMEGEKYIRQVEKSHLSEMVFSSQNEDSSAPKISSTVSADKILEEMVQHDKLQNMFEKVIYQPKESDLIHTFE